MTNNILVFLTDDHAQWAMGTYGCSEIRTPSMDHLAQTGVQMMNAFTPTPVCSPSRACFFTGRLASQHGIHDYLSSTEPEIHHFPWLKDETTLAQYLSEAGYQTGICGKWHMGADDTPHPGFDYWFTMGGAYPTAHFDNYTYYENGQEKVINGYKTPVITDHAVKFLNNIDKEKPFALFICHYATHSPWESHPERLVDSYRNCTFSDIPQDEAYPFGPQSLESEKFDRKDSKEGLAQYYSAVSQIDESVGRILDELENQELRNDTLVVYTADHGLNCGHHGIWGKGNGTLPLNMVEESIRIPLIFNQPGRLFGGQRRAECVNHLDTFQSILEYAGVDLSGEADTNHPGRSFLSLLENTAPIPDWQNIQFGEYGNLRMIRSNRHKLVRRYPNGPCELFDLQADSREQINLFYDPTYKTLIKDLTAQIDHYFSTYEDPINSGIRVAELPRHNTTEAWRNH